MVVPENPIETLKNCNGYYESPKDENGKYIGPVVGYAKMYKDDNGADKNMVGFVYLNFAKAEQRSEVREYFAAEISAKVAQAGLKANVVLGAPMGGLFLAGDIGRILKVRSIFSEKIVLEAADKATSKREVSKMVIDRHDIFPGDRIILVEDVCNNFSTTEQMVELVRSYGAEIVGIACAFNRSSHTAWADVPVISTCDIWFDQYKQDDAAVSEIIARGDFIPKPKLSWNALANAMEEAENKEQ